MTHSLGVRLDEAALFLDLDGTLAPFAAQPRDVGPNPRRSEVLSRLSQALAGRIAVVSGRSLDEIDRILEHAIMSAGGVHGLERRDASGRLHAAPAHPKLGEARESLSDFARNRPGLLVEEKSHSVALHFRGAPDHARQSHAFAADLAREHGLQVQEGVMVVELRTPGPHKGDAVRAFLGEPPFRGAVPIFVGDDLTDEDGFRAAVALGGFGVLVGARRSTAASARLSDVEAVLGWLERSLDLGAFRLEALT